MRNFLSKFIFFLTCIFLILFIGVLLPTTPRASKSLLFSINNKDYLLKSVSSPRIIFLGGSNLSFGLNSKVIQDSLNLFPINTGIHGSLGLKFFIDNTINEIKEGDVVVLCPEYFHFYKDTNIGSEELLRTILDVNFKKLFFLNIYQLFDLVKYVPKYSLSKFFISEYYNYEEDKIYGIHSFNVYGDACAHWGLKSEKFNSEKITGNLNLQAFELIDNFEKLIIKKKAKLFISFPGYQKSSFEYSRDKIYLVYKYYLKHNYRILGNPDYYSMPDSLVFNTPYHLTKEGVAIRTNRLIFDIKRQLIKK
jgi:hypothetical protein